MSTGNIREFVGVRPTHVLLKPYYFKRDALLFHRIAIPGCKAPEAAQIMRREGVANEYDWLLERGIIFEPDNSDKNKWSKILSDMEHNPTMKRVNALLTMKDDDRQVYDAMVSRIAARLNTKDTQFVETFIDFYLHNEYILRPVSVLIRVSQGVDTYPVSTMSLDMFDLTPASKQNVLEIVLRSLPIPDVGVSWEQIFEFRSDPDSMGKFLALRNWMNKVARAQLSPREVEEKLEWLVHDYKKHIELHKMKTTTGTLETVVVAAVECIENLAKFNLGKVARGLFALRARKLQLLEGELNSPGSEIAYVAKVQEIFA